MRVALSNTPARRAVRATPFLTAAGIFLLFLAHRAVVALPATATSPLVPLARLFDLVLVLGALLLAHAAGARVLRALGLASPPVEQAAFATTLGLGLGAYCALALGFIGLYRTPVLLGGVVLAAGLLWRDLLQSSASFAALGRGIVRAGADAPRGTPLIAIMLGFAVLLALLGGLTPPHHWDPLTYHLTVPQRFLQTGRIAPVPGIEFSNLPLTTELLYGIGLAAGSEIFGQLLHGGYALITALGVWGLARRYSDRTTAWLALTLFIGTPLVLVWARVANNDLTLGCFVLLAVAAALRAHPAAMDAAEAVTPGQARRWLGLAGVFAGLALGSKYQAIYAVAPLGIAILVDSWVTHRRVTGSVGKAVGGALGDAVTFGAVLTLVASPWYIKNWLLLNNPIWPTIFGGRDFSPLAAEITADFLRDRVLSPRTPLGYLLLPLRAYTTGDFEQRHVVLNPLFLVCPAMLLLRRLWRRELWYALIVSAGFLAGFVMGVQELRYLLVICPLLSVIAAYVLRLGWKRVSVRRVIMASFACVALLNIALIGLHIGADRPIDVFLGRESRDAYLGENVAYGSTHRALSFLLTQLQPGERVLFMHEAQIFYLPEEVAESDAVRPDHLNLQLLLLSETHPEPQDFLAALQEEGYDYLLINEANIRSWLQSDPNGRLGRGQAALDRLAPLLELVYRGGRADRPSVVIYRVPSAAR